MAKNIAPKSWASWIRASDGVLRSDDPYGTYGRTTPTLPTTMDTSYSLPSGNTWTATNTSNSSIAGTGTGNRTDCSFTYALANCALNDVIVLTAGSSYVGPFTIPNKVSGSGWVYVISSALASLPAYGEATANRVVAADATNMAKIQVTAAAASAAIKVTSNSHHFRFVGIEVTVGPTTTDAVSAMVSLNNSDVSNSTVCHHIIFDRCYIHGGTSATDKGTRGAYISGENLAFVSCRISGFAGSGTETQAILISWGAGPYKIVNNYLEAACENIMTGGVGVGIPNGIASDIEIRHNHFYKPLAWVGAGYNVKNLLEFKESQRVLVEGNTFENCWTEAQTGSAILITPRDQVFDTPWTVCDDTTIRLNKFINCERLLTVGGHDTQDATAFAEGLKTHRVLVENNVALLTTITDGANYGLAMGSGPYAVTFRKNTMFTSAGATARIGYWTNLDTSLAVWPADLFTFKDNVVSYGSVSGAGVGGDGKGTALATLNFYFTNYTCNYNCVIAGTAGDWPSGQAGFPANTSAVGFANYAGGDYTITSGAYMTASSTGGPVGADIAAVNAAIA